MNITKQCCTLDQAKKLKELGIVQESIAAFFYNANTNNYPLFFTTPDDIGEKYSAFTVAELGVMLGDNITPYLITILK